MTLKKNKLKKMKELSDATLTLLKLHLLRRGRLTPEAVFSRSFSSSLVPLVSHLLNKLKLKEFTLDNLHLCYKEERYEIFQTKK